MKREYQALLENIHVPKELKEQVLQAVQSQEPPVPRRRWKPALRAAVCAVCALVLVAGGIQLRPREINEPGIPLHLACTFGLTAYAADLGEAVPPNANGGLAFRTAGEPCQDTEGGYFTGCLFQVTGAQIQSISLTLDRGSFYRWDPAEARPEAVLGSSVTEDYASDRWYGFWVPGAETIPGETDPQMAMKDSLDTLDGATLSVSVTFEDGTVQRRDYLLSTGTLKTVPREDGPGHVLLPQLTGDNAPGWYGIYAVSEAESRWLHWPVQGANTISLSHDYGYHQTPAGQTFHAGIDIPAERGTPVLAAAHGTVIETGFDTEQGNYVKVDHGSGLTTLYAHCSSVDAETGETVTAGEMIAAVGNTGRSTGPHLHFEVRQDGEAQNPTAYFDAVTRAGLRMG